MEIVKNDYRSELPGIRIIARNYGAEKGLREDYTMV